MNFKLKDFSDFSMTDLETGKIVIESKSIPTSNISINNKVTAVAIQDGFKIKVRDTILESIVNDTKIQELFKLNIKRLNRWWYSIYFEKKN